MKICIYFLMGCQGRFQVTVAAAQTEHAHHGCLRTPTHLVQQVRGQLSEPQGTYHCRETGISCNA